MEFAVDQRVRYNDARYIVLEIKRGWLTLIDSTGQQQKARSRDVSPDEPRDMKSQLSAARKRYQRTQSYGGEASYDNGDDLAQLLRGLEPADVCRLADRTLGEEDGFHESRYGHLNPGQQRMNAGNRIRAALKKNTVSMDDLRSACETPEISAATIGESCSKSSLGSEVCSLE